MIYADKSMHEITSVFIHDTWPVCIKSLKPKNVLELGTGQGACGAKIMSSLAIDAVFTTINYVDGHHFGEQLHPWYGDSRLRRLDADTIDPNTLKLVPCGVDLLFIDTTHEAWHAATELCLWQKKLQDGAIVVVDDLNQNDMEAFWASITFEKQIIPGSEQGVFRYDASQLYVAAFTRPNYSTYGPRK